MKNLFDKDSYEEIMQRLNSLTPHSQRVWGKMTAPQMLAHCIQTTRVPLSPVPLPRMFFGRFFGWIMKAQLYNDTPWKHGLPTASDFIIKGNRDFEKEKQTLTSLIKQFYEAGPGGISRFPHPFFGTFTPEQWGKNLYKHFDHHFRQFGV